MSTEQASLTKKQIIFFLGSIWLISNLIDRLWLSLDHFPPGWDQSNHLTTSLNYLHTLQNLDIFNGEWWHIFWKVSTKYPPLTYIITAFFQQVFGTGNDQALLINLFYSALLILSVYTLGKTLFTAKVGIYAAAIIMLLPRLYQTRLYYLLDTPLMTLTIACFCCLTLWRNQTTRKGEWLWTILFGICWGLALLTKQSVMFFLTFPLLYLGFIQLWQRHWQRVFQLFISFIISIFIWFPWYRTNWIYLFSTVQNSNGIPAAAEGDPPVNTIAAWTYYWQDLPLAISWILLIVPLVGLLLHLFGLFPGNDKYLDSKKALRGITWLGIYFVGSYLILSAIWNKDTRYIMSSLPILALFLAYCLTLWRGRWKRVSWLTIAIAFLVMVIKLFPIPGMGGIALFLSPGVLSYPYLNQDIPDRKIIETVIQTNPKQVSTLGVITNTDLINHNTLNYYGALKNFQVYGRELGSTSEQVTEDGQSFDWFVTQTGDNGFAKEAQLNLANDIEKNPDFQLLQNWKLPDNNTLKLYHRKNPPVIVQPLSENRDKVQLDSLTIPDKFPHGIAVPVTYKWSGSWEQLVSGLVLLTWQSVNNKADNNNIWLHDHGIGMGMLYLDQTNTEKSQKGFSVIENTAMLPDANLSPGDYTLTATYLNRQTGETYPISVPKIGIKIDPNAPAIPAPELDLVTKLRQLALNLPKGTKGLDPIFKEVNRINQYDPIQDYLIQAEKTLDYRLKNQPGKQQLNWNYGLLLSQVLQENADRAITTLQKLTKIDPNNPYSHAYLAFIYLYNWQPHAAETALQPALKLKPNDPEINTLKGITALMQGNLIQAKTILSDLTNSQDKK